MNLKITDSMNGTSEILDLISRRQKVLGENLANLDTPGYKRKDVDFSQYMGETSSPIEAKLATKFGPSPVFEESSNEEVNPANELMEIQKNSLLYTMATRRMSNIISEMRTVTNVGK